MKLHVLKSYILVIPVVHNNQDDEGGKYTIFVPRMIILVTVNL